MEGKVETKVGEPRQPKGEKAPKKQQQDNPKGANPNKPQQEKSTQKEKGAATTSQRSDQQQHIEKKQHDKKDDQKQNIPKETGALRKDQHQSQAPPSTVYKLNLFDHLPTKTPTEQPISIEGDQSIHPATIKLGIMYRTGVIKHDDDRVAALCATFSKIIEDYSTPPGKSLSWDLDKYIKIQIQHIVDSRQISVGMGNIIKYLRSAISCLPPDLTETEAKSRLTKTLKIVIEEKIVYARESIITHVLHLIKENDVILTHSSSPLLKQVLLAISSLVTYSLVIVDTRPLNDGVELLSAMSPYIKCTYTTLSGAATLMKDVTHVLLGASALLSNGTILAPAGSAMITAIAKAYRKPVIIVAETYKFSEKVQLDSIVYNELGQC